MLACDIGSRARSLGVYSCMNQPTPVAARLFQSLVVPDMCAYPANLCPIQVAGAESFRIVWDYILTRNLGWNKPFLRSFTQRLGRPVQTGVGHHETIVSQVNSKSIKRKMIQTSFGRPVSRFELLAGFCALIGEVRSSGKSGRARRAHY